jgi:hypothetical protein
MRIPIAEEAEECGEDKAIDDGGAEDDLQFLQALLFGMPALRLPGSKDLNRGIPVYGMAIWNAGAMLALQKGTRTR